jgi:hypothetical protein
MTIRRRHFLLAGGALLVPFGFSRRLAAAPSQQPLAVVELFTSQGCSSCPPADAFLGELAKREDVIALSVHVDYWDYIGWKDMFALPQNTERQREYQQHLSQRYVYTPQIVVQGALQAVGSNRREVLRQIEDAKKLPRIPVSLAAAGAGAMKVAIGEGPLARGEEAAVWFVAIDRAHETPIKRGENSGRTIRYSNVVRQLDRIGTWRGQPAEFQVKLPAQGAPGGDGCAVLVQSTKNGRILGAAFMRAESW